MRDLKLSIYNPDPSPLPEGRGFLEIPLRQIPANAMQFNKKNSALLK
jgi:hypothetical protein